MSVANDINFHGYITMMLKYFDSIYFKWEDKRQINRNEGRNVSCPSKHVEWTSEGQFWVPRIDVWDVIELVRL